MKTNKMTSGKSVSSRLNVKRFSYSPVALLILTSLLAAEFIKEAKAEDFFSPYSLDKRGMQSIADIDTLDVFAKQSGQMPGKYAVEVYLNNDFIELAEINFVNADDGKLSPELTKKQWLDWGVNPNVSSELAGLADEAKIDKITHYIPDATVKFDFSQQKLLIGVPQIAIKSTARGYVSPEQWQQGMPAFTLNYGLSGSKTWQEGSAGQNANFLSLQSGANLGAWRLRNYSVYSQSDTERHWQSISTSLTRDIATLKSQFTVGQVASSGEIFDSFPFTGVRLASDDSMLPYSLRGFAPVVKGIAKSNAKVTVQQNGYVIYQTYVSAGPFEITDLYPTSGSGNLEVSVEEMDGSVQTFITPFSSVPIMQREGQLKYALSGGKYRENSGHAKEPQFFQPTLSYGLPWNTTLYGGGLFSSDYSALALGVGLNLGSAGALSFDVTNAKTDFTHETSRGQSYRFQYAKSLLNSGTSVTLAGYRYSTEGYYDFSEANDDILAQTRINKRSRLQANVSQTLGSYGSVYLNSYQQDFWGRSGTEKTVSAGFNSNWNAVTYGVNYAYSDMPGNGKANHLMAFNMSIPFDAWLPNSRINSSIGTDNRGTTNMQLGLSGNALDNTLNYGIQQSLGNRDQQSNGNLTLSYRGNNGIVNGGYSYNSQSQRLNYGMQGGMVLHPEGVTLSQPLGETVAIVRAPDAENVAVKNRTGITTNALGYAVVPYLTPYQRNNIQLDVESLGNNVDLASTSATVVPTRGAVVWADFETHIGWRALIKLVAQGQNIPFGAVVSLVNTDSAKAEIVTGIVGDNGEVYLNGLPEKGRLQVKWGERSNQQCWADFSLPKDKNVPVIQTTATCITE
ncbi:putative outer membrane protein [Enterobacterales bacterium 8AC]|nr:putative outer membrane protein [Enterobacterales bacterium 8AC]